MNEEIKKEQEQENERLSSINNEIDDESLRLNTLKNIQEELTKMNDSLNACISIAEASVGNKIVRERCKDMREENEKSNKISNQALDSSMQESSEKLEELNQYREQSEERLRDLNRELETNE